MEPQPGSPPSPPSPGTPPSPGSAKVTTPDEPMEEVTEQEPGRKSTSSSSSSSSSESSAESPRHVDVVELGDTLLPAPEDEQVVVASSIQSAEGKPDGSATVGDEHADPPVQGAGGKPDDCATLEDEHAAPEHSAEVKPDDRALPEDEQAAATAVLGAEVKPDDWATWPEPPSPAVDYSSSSDSSAGAAPTGLTEAPQVQTMAKLGGAGAGTGEFDPQRIPASVFQTRASMSQAEWSMTSNESLFSIQGASDVGGPYAGSRSHFDFFYDEAMAAAEAESKLPSVAEGMESAEFAAPGSASSRASGGSPNAKKATVFRRHDSGSGGSSSNFSFAFPILAPTSPKKKDLVGSALFQPLEKEYDQQPPELEPHVSAFEEMTTEAERRQNTGCGCCWFDCSWATWCGWWRCCGSCSCSCPSFCRRSWCPCS
ncbi:mucin-7-like [Panicum miliaceum]|uniref:Mucin-7-like n=1 Tax=Panicum miliaceum TaxID=4540 RepID=A0A3L6SPZ1_PANMI|nr:mucin-7-like [Panicum miliaceum]